MKISPASYWRSKFFGSLFVCLLSQLCHGQNLIINGNFDSGDLNGWTITQGNPTPITGGTFQIECFGSHLLFAGTSSQTRLHQLVDLHRYADAIDTGRLPFRISAALGSWVDVDEVNVSLQFQTDDKQPLGSETTISSEGNPFLNSGLLGLIDYRHQEVQSGFVPKGARIARIEILSERNSGTDNDGYVDVLKLQLAPEDLNPTPLTGVEVIGHRGNSSAAPENTIPAILSAYEVGADHIEVDVRLTSDGVAVLMHDTTVNRTTDGFGLIANMTLSQVKNLDAGSWFGPEFAGAEVPTLAEALVAVGQRGRILLDIKVDGMGSAIDNALNEASTLGDRIYTAEDLWLWPGPNADYATNLIDAEYLLGSIPANSVWQSAGYFESQRAIGVRGWDVSSGQMSSGFAAAARAEGLVASVYTINDVFSMQQFVNLGVTAMETDFPEVLADLVVLRGDVNLDQQVNLLDVQPFVQLLLDSAFQNEADTNEDGLVDIQDIANFVELIVDSP